MRTYNSASRARSARCHRRASSRSARPTLTAAPTITPGRDALPTGQAIEHQDDDGRKEHGAAEPDAPVAPVRSGLIDHPRGRKPRLTQTFAQATRHVDQARDAGKHRDDERERARYAPAAAADPAATGSSTTPPRRLRWRRASHPRSRTSSATRAIRGRPASKTSAMLATIAGRCALPAPPAACDRPHAASRRDRNGIRRIAARHHARRSRCRGARPGRGAVQGRHAEPRRVVHRGRLVRAACPARGRRPGARDDLVGCHAVGRDGHHLPAHAARRASRAGPVGGVGRGREPVAAVARRPAGDPREHDLPRHDPRRTGSRARALRAWWRARTSTWRSRPSAWTRAVSTGRRARRPRSSAA